MAHASRMVGNFRGTNLLDAVHHERPVENERSLGGRSAQQQDLEVRRRRCIGDAQALLRPVEDRDASVDMNLVMSARGEFIELQGTGEESTFSEAQLMQMLALGKAAIKELLAAQKVALGK